MNKQISGNVQFLQHFELGRSLSHKLLGNFLATLAAWSIFDLSGNFCYLEQLLNFGAT